MIDHHPDYSQGSREGRSGPRVRNGRKDGAICVGLGQGVSGGQTVETRCAGGGIVQRIHDRHDRECREGPAGPNPLAVMIAVPSVGDGVGMPYFVCNCVYVARVGAVCGWGGVSAYAG